MKKTALLLVGIVMLISGVAFAGSAMADASSATDTSWTLIAKYGPIWGGMLFGYLLAQKWLAKYKADHPVAQGKVLALITSGVGLLGTLLVMHFDGGSSAGLVVTLLGAGKLMTSPTVTSTPTLATAGSTGQGGFFRLEVAAVLIAIGAMIGLVAITACQTPAVQNAEHAGLAAGEVCAKQDAKAILQPLEGEGVTLLGKVSAALIAGAGKTAIDDGVAQAKTDLGTLPTAIETSVVDCAIKTAIGAFSPLVVGHGFAGGDARLTQAAAIGERLLAEHGVSSQ